MIEQTPYSVELDEGVYEITFPETVSIQGKTYSFDSWSDGYQYSTRTINLVSDKYLNALYTVEQFYDETPNMVQLWTSMGTPTKKMVSPRSGSRHVKAERPYRIEIISENQTRHVLIL